MLLLLSGFLVCSVARIDDGDVWAEMPPAVSMQHLTPHHFRSLEKENFQKTSLNFFDLKPNCEQLGTRYCDYDRHDLGSGLEFASWLERTQFVYVNMARMDYAKFQQAPYNAQYACSPKSGLVPFYWSSELTQASRFHSHEMATLGFFSHQTSPQNADLFGNSVQTGNRIKYFMTSTWRGWGENIAAGRGSALDVTKQWLSSSGHCTQMFGGNTFMGVGYFYSGSSKYRHYWTENFWKGPALPTTDILSGTHDTATGTNRFLAQVHMSQAPNKVSLVIGGTTKTMSLLLGSATTGTYFVDISTLPSGESDGCVPYYFEVNSGASRMPADTSYHFLTYGVNNCKRNIGTGNQQPSPTRTTQPSPTRTTARKLCNCPNGSPKTGTACTSNGATLCARCNTGFTLNARQTCVATGGGGGGNLPACTAVPVKSRGKCETCFHGSQCIDGFYCCPYLRKCVSSSRMPCGYPIGNCRPMCFDSKCKLGQGCTGCEGCTGLGAYTWLEWANLANQGKQKTCTSTPANTARPIETTTVSTTTAPDETTTMGEPAAGEPSTTGNSAPESTTDAEGTNTANDGTKPTTAARAVSDAGVTQAELASVVGLGAVLHALLQ